MTAIALQADGRILLGGDFTEVAGRGTRGIARLRNGQAISRIVTRGDFEAEWLTGGTAPEVAGVRFQLDTGGGWQDLGSGVRTAGGWGIGGLALPTGGSLRALGSPHTAGGQACRIGRVLVLDSPLNLWREQTFEEDAGDPSIAGDFADPDGDGLFNIAEYASGTNPRDPRSLAQPSGGVGPGGLTFTYPCGVGATDIDFGLEQSTDLLDWVPASYTEEVVSDNGIVRMMRATVPINLAAPPIPGAYLRARITHAP